MSPRPFLSRLIVPFAAMLVLLVVVCGAVVYWAGQEQVYRQQIANLDHLAGLVRQWLPPGAEAVGPAERERLLQAARVLDTRITLIDAAGRVVLDTHADAGAMENHASRPEVVEARQAGIGSSVRQSDTLHEQVIYVARPLDPGEPGGMVVRVSYPHSAMVAGRAAARPWLILGASAVAAVVILAAMGAVLQRQWVNPVRHLARVAEDLAAGRWSARAVVAGGASDVRFFADRLNSVAAQAEQQLADLRDQRRDLQALVDTLPDPVLLADSRGRVTLLNTAASRLLGLPAGQAVGRRIVEVVTDQTILDAFDALVLPPSPADNRAGAAADEPGSPMQRQVRVSRDGQRLTYQAVASRTTGGALLVLRDITAVAHMVQMKTDFVANASHELRTPVAAIKVALETLHDVHADDPQQTQRCVRVIDGHVRRLEELLRDLLDLSRLESPELRPQLAAVRPGDLFAALRATLGPVAREKGVEVAYESRLPAGEPFRGDERLLNLVLKNLVENAVKFTPPGGRVDVTVERSTGGVDIRVRDTGIGIPPEHQHRVFERFYQVNPARSGSAGRGTGLGLAIVKHAVNALGGSVSLESEPGRETTVTCSFPQPSDHPHPPVV